MNSIQKLATSLSMVMVLVAVPTLAWITMPSLLDETTGGSAPRSDAYREAQRALDAGDWSTAEELFGQLGSGQSAEADAAMYWQAWSQYKSARESAALQTLKRLESRYPESPWVDDARALQIEIEGVSAQDWDRPDSDEELKLYALSSLMSADPDRALPILEEYVRGDHSPRLKERALFVLSQSDSERAGDILVSVASDSSNPEAALRAIEYLGMVDGPETVRQLQEIYRATDETRVKSRVLQAFAMGDHKEPILAAARGEQEQEVRGRAVELLGVMDAVPELQQLYAEETSKAVKLRILEALFVADDVDTLLEVARGESDPSLKAKAIEGLALIGSPATTEALDALYGSNADMSVKHKILEAYMLQDNTDALIAVARTEEDRQLRRHALQMLSLMDTEAASEFMLEILEQN